MANDANLVCCIAIDFQALFEDHAELALVGASSMLQNAQMKMDIAPFSRHLVCIYKDTIYLTLLSAMPASRNSSRHFTLQVIDKKNSTIQSSGQKEMQESDSVTFSDARWITNEYFCISDTMGFIYLYHYQDGLKLKQVRELPVLIIFSECFQ